jgi:hypothetical protein
MGALVNRDIDWGKLCKSKGAFVVTSILRSGYENIPSDLKSVLVKNKKAINSITDGVKGTDHIKEEIEKGDIKVSVIKSFDELKSKYPAPKELAVPVSQAAAPSEQPSLKKQKVTDGQVENLFADEEEGEDDDD